MTRTVCAGSSQLLHFLMFVTRHKALIWADSAGQCHQCHCQDLPMSLPRSAKMQGGQGLGLSDAFANQGDRIEPHTTRESMWSRQQSAMTFSKRQD